MIFLLLTIVAILSLSISKYYFGKWFNHLAIYTSIWFGLIFLYELKLLKYVEINTETWFVITVSFSSFLFGTLIYKYARRAAGFSPTTTSRSLFDNPLFEKNGTILKVAILVTGLIGLLGALQHWVQLINKFGSIPQVFVFANIIYQARVQGEYFDALPYVSTFSFVSIFLAGIYCAYKNKISLIVLLPFIAVVLEAFANVGRASILFAFVEFISAFFLGRYGNKREGGKFFKAKGTLIFNLLFLLIIIIISANFVKSLRAVNENFKESSNVIKNTNLFGVITPSIYLYLSSDIGVLNKFLEHNNEVARFGENTFMPVYNILAKFHFVGKPNTYQKGYYIPMWVNTGTYLRESIADFGVFGATLYPFLLGLLISLFWFRFIESNKIEYLIMLVFFFIIIFFTFLMNITRMGSWFLSIVLLFLIIPLLQWVGSNFLNKSKMQIENSAKRNG